MVTIANVLFLIVMVVYICKAILKIERLIFGRHQFTANQRGSIRYRP